MIRLFYMGEPVFMGILTLLFAAMVVVAVINGLPIFKSNQDSDVLRRRISYIKSVGLFALVVGILGQLLGLYNAFNAIEMVGDVSPSLLAGGLKVSMITTIYGFFIYVISFLIWFFFSWKLK